jgi:hypothetical protein
VGDADVPRETSATVSDVSVSDTHVSDTSRRIDLSDWFTKQQAADAIGVSTKAIERFAQAGKLEQRSRPQTRGPNVAVYFPDDVARLASERRPGPPAPFVVPTPAAPTNGHNRDDASLRVNASTTALQHLPSNDSLRTLAELVVGLLAQTPVSQTSETFHVQPTMFVGLRDASRITGLSQALLRRYIASGGLKAIKDGAGGFDAAI